MTNKYLLTLAWLIIPVSSASAQGPEPLVTDRPDQTESAVTVRPGFVQIEGGISLTQADDGGRRRTVEVPSTLVRIGVLDRLEARLGFAGWQRSELQVGDANTRDDGVGDLDVGAKLLLLEERAGRPQLAILISTTLPTGESGFSSERADPTLLLAGSNTVSERLSIGYNVGAQWSTIDGGGIGGGDRLLETAVHATYSLAVGISLAERVGAFAESFGALDFNDGGSNPFSLDGGLTFLVRPNLQFDLSAGVGLNEAADDWFVAGGVSVRVPR